MKTLAPPVIASRNRVRRITDKEQNSLEQAEIDFRFVREVERLEKEGRVRSRTTLEKDLGLSKGAISVMRLGQRGTSPLHLRRLKEKYNGDFYFILFGMRDPHETSGPRRMGRALDIYTGYTHRYAAPAAWKCGPRAEEDPLHYPDDPQNELHPWRTEGQPTRPVALDPSLAPNFDAVRAALTRFEQRRLALPGAPDPVYYVVTNAKEIEGVELVIENKNYAKGKAYRAAKPRWHELLDELRRNAGVGVEVYRAPTPHARRFGL